MKSDKAKCKRQIVYVLTNSCMDNVIKIGRTDNLDQRLKDLYKTNVPLPFECFFACTVKDSEFVERNIHDAFEDKRISPKREFFEIDPNHVVSALKLAMIEDVTPNEILVEDDEEKDAIEGKNKKPFNFDMVGIKKGAMLTFSRDENISVTVIDNKNIEYQGEVTSLSALAKKLLGRSYSVQGPRYWKYKGETLLERRTRIMEE